MVSQSLQHLVPHGEGGLITICHGGRTSKNFRNSSGAAPGLRRGTVLDSIQYSLKANKEVDRNCEWGRRLPLSGSGVHALDSCRELPSNCFEQFVANPEPRCLAMAVPAPGSKPYKRCKHVCGCTSLTRPTRNKLKRQR